MKTTVLLIIATIMLTGCVTMRQPVERTYYSLNEIKRDYQLTNRECRQIVRDARTGKIDIIYHAGRDEWMYDATVDYSTYKTTNEQQASVPN